MVKLPKNNLKKWLVSWTNKNKFWWIEIYFLTLCKIKYMFNKELLVVVETEMSDGVDLHHLWKTKQEALESERFDFLYDCDMDRWLAVEKSTTIIEMIKAAGHPFYIKK